MRPYSHIVKTIKATLYNNTLMKKMFVCLTVLMTMAAAVVTYATGIIDIKTGKEFFTVASTCVDLSTKGSGGACTHPGCGCMGFNQRPGYYQCWCGHQRFTHK